MAEMVSAKAGAKLRIEAVVSGKPVPSCKWMRGENVVVPSSRLAVHKSANLCVLIIKDVSRTDSGEYSLSAENSCGKVEEALKIIIRGSYYFYHYHFNCHYYYCHYWPSFTSTRHVWFMVTIIPVFGYWGCKFSNTSVVKGYVGTTLPLW